MKAEQRKELETNTLADKMGRVMQRVQTSPRRTFLIYAMVGLAVVAAAWFGWSYRKGIQHETSFLWLKLYDGGGNQIEDLAQNDKDSEAGKAARLQIAWLNYWEFGIKMLALNKPALGNPGAMANIKKSVELYADLAEDCKDDPVYGPQAMLGRAVAQESRAVEDRKHLKEAEQYYEELANHKKFDKSAEAKFAKDRLDILKDPEKRAQLAVTYATLQGSDLLDIPSPLIQQFNPHKDNIPDFFPKARP